MMKQPELGRKIMELRKSKGLTQEELVEKCNISVRTIQRIETGEVTPRSYTIKTILAALESDLHLLNMDESNFFEEVSGFFRNLLLIDVDTNKPSTFVYNQLNLAWIAGLLYFIVGFFEGAADYFLYSTNELIYSPWVYVGIKITIIVSYIMFQRGFIMLGGLFNNYLLKIVSIILIGANILMIGHDIASIFYDAIEKEVILFGAALSFGGIGILYGISLVRLRNYLGAASTMAGLFEIITACFFLTVILSFIGFMFQVPALLLQIVMLYQAIELLKRKEKNMASDL